MSNRPLALGIVCTVACAVLAARPAAAQATIKNSGDHPAYSFEAEPHLAVDPFGADGIGPGFRGTIVLVDDGFVTTINNSVGLGFGLDWLFYDDHCNGRDCDGRSAMILPVVLQWNFWLHRNWSVFGEPGLALRVRERRNDDELDLDPFVIYAGGRWHFSEYVALTLRLGAPVFHHAPFSIGVSFLL